MYDIFVKKMYTHYIKLSVGIIFIIYGRNYLCEDFMLYLRFKK